MCGPSHPSIIQGIPIFPSCTFSWFHGAFDVQVLELLKRLRFATTSIGSNTLGFTAKDVGLHSARSGAAMAMYLAHIPVFTIMLLGCWSSNAFLRYIRKQVKEFSNGISSKMMQHEHFFTIPSTSIEDPRVSNNHLNLACRNKHGHSFKDTVRPLASVFH